MGLNLRNNPKVTAQLDRKSTFLMDGQVTIKEAENTIDQAQENLNMAAEGRGEYG